MQLVTVLIEGAVRAAPLCQFPWQPVRQPDVNSLITGNCPFSPVAKTATKICPLPAAHSISCYCQLNYWCFCCWLPALCSVLMLGKHKLVCLWGAAQQPFPQSCLAPRSYSLCSTLTQGWTFSSLLGSLRYNSACISTFSSSGLGSAYLGPRSQPPITVISWCLQGTGSTTLPSPEPTFEDAQVPHRQPSVCKDAELMDVEGDCNPASKICYFLIFHSHLHGFSPFKK